jgi:hypothetical protein
LCPKRRGCAHCSFRDHLEELVGVGYAPDLRYLTTRGRDKARVPQGLGALLGIAEEKKVWTGWQADIQRAMRTNGRIDGPKAHGTFGGVPDGKCHAAPALQHPERLAERDVRAGKVTHAKGVDDGIEGIGLERQRFRIGLLEPDRGVPLARHAHLCR